MTTDDQRAEIARRHADYRVRSGTPEYWVEQGYVRNWGDCAIMRLPALEILRRETDADGNVIPREQWGGTGTTRWTKVEYLLVGEALGLPGQPGHACISAELDIRGILHSWGSY